MSFFIIIKVLNKERRRRLLFLLRSRLPGGIRGRRSSCLNIPHSIRMRRLTPRALRRRLRLRGLILLVPLYEFVLLLILPLLFVNKSRLMTIGG